MTDVHVAAAIIHQKGRVLATRRTDAESGGWELPGGRIEPGESAEQALERALAERLGCEVASAWPYDGVERTEGNQHLTMECFVCRLADGSKPALDSSAHAELRWVSRDELGELDWMPADAEVAERLAFFWDEALHDQLL